MRKFRTACLTGVASAVLVMGLAGMASQALAQDTPAAVPAGDPAAIETGTDASATELPPASEEPAAPELLTDSPEPPTPPAPAPTISDQIAAGKFLFESRLRYEGVDQTKTATLTEKGEGLTLRTRLGWETAAWRNLKALIEFEDVRQVGSEHYAVNVPGAATLPLNGADKARYPIINDPDVTELNRLQVTWTPSASLSVVAGRQRILLDDHRFVGNVGWRQDEQTFDAVRMDGSLGRVKATYAYIVHVNRILGELRDWDSDSHLLNVTWSPSEIFRLQGFGYALDFDTSPVNASLTTGLKASGKTWVGLYQLAYNATVAEQEDYKGGTAPFSLGYLAADIAGTFDIYTARLGYESLEGNGTRGFTTPLATVHAFQGWSDAFVSPGGNKGFVDGIKDLNLTFNIKPRIKFTYLANLDLIARYHDFSSERTGADLGHEWNLQATFAITPKLSFQAKYADFTRENTVPVGSAAPPASRTKAWFTLEYKL